MKLMVRWYTMLLQFPAIFAQLLNNYDTAIKYKRNSPFLTPSLCSSRKLHQNWRFVYVIIRCHKLSASQQWAPHRHAQTNGNREQFERAQTSLNKKRVSCLNNCNHNYMALGVIGRVARIHFANGHNLFWLNRSTEFIKGFGFREVNRAKIMAPI